MNNKKAIIIVNSVTFIRVLGTFLMPIVSGFLSIYGMVIYLVSLLLTDAIDGFLARKLKASTLFGSLLDAAADKLLGIATLAILAQSYPIMLLPILTEGLIMIINTRGAAVGAIIESSKLGKIKTVLLGLAVVIGFCTIHSETILSSINFNTAFGTVLINILNYASMHNSNIMMTIASITVGAGLMVASDYHINIKNEIKKAKDEGLIIKEIKLKKGKDLLHALFDEEYYQKTRKEPLLIKLGEKDV